jgi:Flp pilus assembly protein TadD
MSAESPLDRDAMRLIAEIGFMGGHTRQFAASRALFESLKTLRPESTLPHIGLAMTELAADRADEAARVLREDGLKFHPDDGELMAFLGLALQSAGRNGEAHRVLTDVVQRDGAGAGPHVRMAEKLLATRAA